MLLRARRACKHYDSIGVFLIQSISVVIRIWAHSLYTVSCRDNFIACSGHVLAKFLNRWINTTSRAIWAYSFEYTRDKPKYLQRTLTSCARKTSCVRQFPTLEKTFSSAIETGPCSKWALKRCCHLISAKKKHDRWILLSLLREVFDPQIQWWDSELPSSTAKQARKEKEAVGSRGDRGGSHWLMISTKKTRMCCTAWFTPEEKYH